MVSTTNKNRPAIFTRGPAKGSRIDHTHGDDYFTREDGITWDDIIDQPDLGGGGVFELPLDATVRDWNFRFVKAEEVRAINEKGLNLLESGGIGIHIEDTTGLVNIGLTSNSPDRMVHMYNTGSALSSIPMIWAEWTDTASVYARGGIAAYQAGTYVGGFHGYGDGFVDGDVGTDLQGDVGIRSFYNMHFLNKTAAGAYAIRGTVLTASGVLEWNHNIHIMNGKELHWYDTGSSHFLSLEAPALTSDQKWIMPDDDAAAANQAWISDAAGNFGWSQSIGTGDSPTFAGLTLGGALEMGNNDINDIGQQWFNATAEEKISYYGDNEWGQTTMYGVGVEANTLYWKTLLAYRWYISANADAGTSDSMELTATDLTLSVDLDVNSNNINNVASLDNGGSAVQFDDILHIPDGTLADPSLAFASETGLGIYRKGSRTLAFVANGTEAMSFNESQVSYAGNIYVSGTAEFDGTVYSDTLLVLRSGGNTTELDYNYFRPKSATTFYFDQYAVGRDFVWRTSKNSALDTTFMTLDASVAELLMGVDINLNSKNLNNVASIDGGATPVISVDGFSFADTIKNIYGTGGDVEEYYDGTDMNLVTDIVAPSDFKLDCGTEKTLELAEVVYNDFVLPLDSAKVPAANAPNWETFVGNLKAYAYSVNDYQEFTTELVHGYKEGSTFEFHIHGALNAALAGGDETVKFEVEYSVADMDPTDGVGDVFPATTTVNAEFIVPNGTADLTNIYISVGTDATAAFLIGATVKGRIRRIASSGTELVGNIFLTQVGMHYEINTMGSRQQTVK